MVDNKAHLNCNRCVGGTYTTWDARTRRHVRVTCGWCKGTGWLAK
jgi:hypothetical protein